MVRRSGLHVSHRQARGMGGKREDWDDLSQWNMLCGACHLFFVERRPIEARNHGYKVAAGLSCRTSPVRTVWGWAMLTSDGGYEWLPVAPIRAAL